MGLLNLKAFTPRTVGDALTVLNIVERSGVTTIEEAKSLLSIELNDRRPKDPSHIAEQRTNKHHSLSDKSTGMLCTKCGSRGRILPVNDKPSTQVGGDFKSCVLCTNNACKHVDYYVDTPNELNSRKI